MKMIKTTNRSKAMLLACVVALGSAATNASANDQVVFRLSDHGEGRTISREAPPLSITLEVRRTGLRISGADRSEICASFENVSGNDWSGGYRLTDRDVRDTHASLRVAAYETVQRCETLNPQMVYYVVLRRD
jgi:hypothetical protein